VGKRLYRLTTNNEEEILNIINKDSKSFTKYCNEEQILAIFNLGNKTVNDCLMKSCEHDKELEEIMMENDDLKKYYSMYIVKHKL
jgi:hypothetical protein